MGKVLMIGAGGVATVAAFKIAQNADVFTDFMIASRTKAKCDKIVEAIGNPNIKTAQVDADDVDYLKTLESGEKNTLVELMDEPKRREIAARLQCARARKRRGRRSRSARRESRPRAR